MNFRAERCSYKGIGKSLGCLKIGNYEFKGKKYCHLHIKLYKPLNPKKEFYLLSHYQLLSQEPLSHNEIVKWMAEAALHPDFDPHDPYHVLVLKAAAKTETNYFMYAALKRHIDSDKKISKKMKRKTTREIKRKRQPRQRDFWAKFRYHEK